MNESTKTILVVYANRALSHKAALALKKYAFNTDDSTIAVGDRFKAVDYSDAMQVVEVLEESFRYVNTKTGDLSNRRTSTNQFELRRIVLQDHCDNTVYATRVNDE